MHEFPHGLPFLQFLVLVAFAGTAADTGAAVAAGAAAAGLAGAVVLVSIPEAAGADCAFPILVM